MKGQMWLSGKRYFLNIGHLLLNFQRKVTKGKLHFGTWEQIFYGEFDGKRKKRLKKGVLVKIIGE